MMDEVLQLFHLLLRGIRAPLLAKSNNSSDKTTVVLHALVSAARGFLLLILLRYLWRLASHFPCAGQRSMHLTHGCWRRKYATKVVEIRAKRGRERGRRYGSARERVVTQSQKRPHRLALSRLSKVAVMVKLGL
jgi:hypothetical protein